MATTEETVYDVNTTKPPYDVVFSYQGAFGPPTAGHITSMHMFANQILIDYSDKKILMLFMPTAFSVDKTHLEPTQQNRFDVLNAFCDILKNRYSDLKERITFQVSDIEYNIYETQKKNGVVIDTGTYLTLEKLNKEYQKSKILLGMGKDNMLQLPSWKNIGHYKSQYNVEKIYVVNRELSKDPTKNNSDNNDKPEIVVLSGSPPATSSSMLRYYISKYIENENDKKIIEIIENIMFGEYRKDITQEKITKLLDETIQGYKNINTDVVENINTTAPDYEKEYNDIGWNDLDIKTVKENFWKGLVIKLEEQKSEEQKSEEQNSKEQEFNSYLTTHRDNINKILNRYNIGMISATTYNDYYKFTMSGVIFKVEEYFKNNNNIRVTFGIDIRNTDIASKLLKSAESAESNELYKKLIINLNKLKTRYFNESIFKDVNKVKDVNEEKKISHIWTPENIAKLAGKPLIDEVVEPVKQGDEVVQDGKQGDEVVQLGEQNEKVTISIYVGPNNKQGSQDKEKLYIEATGPWHRVTWLETSLMQCVYKTVLEDYLHSKKKSYEQWLLESMFRCYLSIHFANKLNTENKNIEDENIQGDNIEDEKKIIKVEKKIIKGALFSGRRTGSFLFTMIQVYMMETFYNNYLGSSSVDAWFQLKNIVNQSSQTNTPNLAVQVETTVESNKIAIHPPIGTHAHEMSMVLSSLFPELDKTIVGSQILGHYLYYLFVNKKTEIPMLPDTLGTDAFMLAANYIQVDKDQVDKEPFIKKINNARQDSGTTKGFKEKMTIWNFKNPVMASEIEDTKTLIEAKEHGYDTFGAGGFFGDSEKVWNVSSKKVSNEPVDNTVSNEPVDNTVSNEPVDNKPFSATMAVKAIRVLSNINNGIDRYPVKLGDGAGKETAYTRLSTDVYKKIIDNKTKLKQYGEEATEALKNPVGEETTKALKKPVGKKDITKKDILLILKKIISNETTESTQLESKLNEPQKLFDEIINKFIELDNNNSAGGNRIRKTRKKRRNGNYLHNKSKRRNGNYLHNKSKRKGGKRRTRRL